MCGRACSGRRDRRCVRRSHRPLLRASTIGPTSVGVIDPQTNRLVDEVPLRLWPSIVVSGLGVFSGRVPHERSEIARNEDGFAETWRDFTDLEVSCLV
jgi:hypothetical protein